MRLLFIRHGDPDYEHDSLTPTGKREAQQLAERMAKEEMTDIYVSPLGRARETAEPTLRATGRESVVCDWLREFPAVVDVNASPVLAALYPDAKKKPDGTFELRHLFWDMAPAGWTGEAAYFDAKRWRETEPAKAGDMGEVYDRVCSGFDALLAAHGYERRGGAYHTEQGNHDTLVFFCHFGLTSVLLSHLWNVSPFVPPHMLCLAPTSVTELWSEEREKGEVIFRASKVGDVSHLYACGEQPSFSARFCETYEDADQRH